MAESIFLTRIDYCDNSAVNINIEAEFAINAASLFFQKIDEHFGSPLEQMNTEYDFDEYGE